MSEWQVYVLRCDDGRLYTGIATDVERRLAQHSDGKGAKALRGKGPFSLQISAPVGNRSQAQRVEASIKRLPKSEKEILVGKPAMLEKLIKDLAWEPVVEQGNSEEPGSEE